MAVTMAFNKAKLFHNLRKCGLMNVISNGFDLSEDFDFPKTEKTRNAFLLNCEAELTRLISEGQRNGQDSLTLNFNQIMKPGGRNALWFAQNFSGKRNGASEAASAALIASNVLCDSHVGESYDEALNFKNIQLSQLIGEDATNYIAKINFYNACPDKLTISVHSYMDESDEFTELYLEKLKFDLRRAGTILNFARAEGTLLSESSVDSYRQGLNCGHELLKKNSFLENTDLYGAVNSLQKDLDDYVQKLERDKNQRKKIDASANVFHIR